MSTTYRVLVSGSRDWPDGEMVWDKLDAAATAAREAAASLFVVVHGGCLAGADQMAAQWCAFYPLTAGWLPVVEEIHRAAWGEFGRAAGMRRNKQMVSTRPDETLVFIRGNSQGASNTLAEAIRAHLPRIQAFELKGANDA